MIWRHKEFVLRYNAECDAAHPRSTAEIIREIEAEERLRNAAMPSAPPAPAAPPVRSTAGVAPGASADPLVAANAAYGMVMPPTTSGPRRWPARANDARTCSRI